MIHGSRRYARENSCTSHATFGDLEESFVLPRVVDGLCGKLGVDWGIRLWKTFINMYIRGCVHAYRVK